MPPVLLHFTRETRPWQHPPRNGSEWFGGCAASVCAAARGVGSAAAARADSTRSVGDSVGGSGRIGRLGALHPEWRALCAARRPAR